MHELSHVFTKNGLFAVRYRTDESVRGKAPLNQLVPKSVIDDPGAICTRVPVDGAIGSRVLAEVLTTAAEFTAS
jgi:hypothetical protein